MRMYVWYGGEHGPSTYPPLYIIPLISLSLSCFHLAAELSRTTLMKVGGAAVAVSSTKMEGRRVGGSIYSFSSRQHVVMRRYALTSPFRASSIRSSLITNRNLTRAPRSRTSVRADMPAVGCLKAPTILQGATRCRSRRGRELCHGHLDGRQLKPHEV